MTEPVKTAELPGRQLSALLNRIFRRDGETITESGAHPIDWKYYPDTKLSFIAKGVAAFSITIGLSAVTWHFVGGGVGAGCAVMVCAVSSVTTANLLLGSGD